MDYEYNLRKEDFIPVVGLAKHHKRCIKEMNQRELFSEEYAAQAWGRDALLGIYNTILLIGTFVGIAKGIEAILSH